MYRNNHIKITLLGVLTDTEEIFSTGFRVGAETTNVDQTQWDSINEVVMDNIGSAAIALWTNQDTRIPNQWALTSIKFAWVDREDNYLADAKEFELPTTGGGGIFGFSPQLALVASLVSSKRKDPGRYNRMYFPTTIPSLYGGAYLNSDQQTDFAQAVSDFITDVNNILAAGVSPLIQARVFSAKWEGNTLPIVQVRAGRVIDTQRRRRNKLVEDYVTINVSS